MYITYDIYVHTYVYCCEMMYCKTVAHHSMTLYTHIHVRMYVYTHIHMYVCVSIIMLILITINSILYTHTYVYVHACIVYTHVHDKMHMYVRTCVLMWFQNNIHHHTIYVCTSIGRRGVRQLAHSPGNSRLFIGEGPCPFPPKQTDLMRTLHIREGIHYLCGSSRRTTIPVNT